MNGSPFVVYDSDGKIVRSGRCPLRMVAYQADPHKMETSIKAEGDDKKHEVFEGKVVTKEEAVELKADRDKPKEGKT